MSGVRKHFKFAPVTSPSLAGFSINANVCRNPACDNFGVSQEDIQSAKYGYAYNNKNGVLIHSCKRCKQTHVAYSNVSVLEAFHRGLRNSIPYASCPNQDCKNHHVNLFEHYFGDLRDKREKYYRVNVENDAEQYYQARCRGCGASFPLSKPLHLHTSKRRTWLKDIEKFIDAVVDGAGPSNVMNQMRVHGDLYYSQLRAASNDLLNYNNFHLIKLMRGAYAPEQLQIYTDCIVCSIKTHRKDERHQKMKIVVSSCVQNNRSLILAFHPLFDARVIDDDTITKDDELPLAQRRFHSLKPRFSLKKGDSKPLLDVGGHAMDEFYGYLSHFLVLRKLLAQVPSLQFYMDGEAPLYNAALTAFSDRVKSRSCDVVVRKMEKEKKGSQSRVPEVLDRAYQCTRAQAKRAFHTANPGVATPNTSGLRQHLLSEEVKKVNEAIRESSTKENGELFPEPLSRIYKTAINRANTQGRDFWVTDQLSNKYNADSRMLWLTRTAERFE
ncbi:MAG: hypothetical protein AB2604_01845 [Candidatus Thiodiazotropha taylori]